MKNRHTFMAMLICCTIYVIGCAQTGTSKNGSQSVIVSKTVERPSTDPLDLSIREASNYLNETLPHGNKLVIINVATDSEILSDYIIEELIANIVNDKVFTVVDRQQLVYIRAEQNYQLSGEVDDDTATEIGKFVGAQTIISASMVNIGDRYRLSLRALDVLTAQVQGQFNKNITDTTSIADLSKRQNMSTTKSLEQQEKTQPKEKIEKSQKKSDPKPKTKPKKGPKAKKK